MSFTIGLTGWAQNSKASQGKDDTTPTALEDQWVRALEKGDAATLDSIFADTYVDTDEEGNRTNKQGVLSAVKSGDLKIQSLTLSDIQTHRYGEAAVVTGSSAQIGAYKGTPLASHIVFTDTFIRQNGRWSAVASQRTVKH